MADAFLPAHMVVTGVGVPSVCSRHGEPVAKRRKTTFQSRPPPWSYLLILVGVLVFVIVAAVLRKQLAASGWPFCARCVDERRNRLLAGAALMLSAVLATTVAVVLANDISAWLALFSLVAALAGLFFFAAAAPAALARAEVTQDGTALKLRRVSPGFVASLPAVPPPPPGWGPSAQWPLPPPLAPRW